MTLPDRREQGDASVEEPEGLIRDERKGEAGARAVLIAWARALERKEFAEARSFFSEQGARNVDFSDRLGQFDTITVAAPVGRMDGMAGALRYSSPVTVTGTNPDGTRAHLQGPIVLRRVNDAVGSSPEHLRWHIESLQLKPIP